MFTPNFNQDQYLDADSFNTAANSVSGSIASGLVASCFPGLVSDNSASYTASGLLVSAQLPAPFGVIFGTGILSNAHGVTSGADTQTYVVSFSGLVPVSGAPVTAYAIASYQQIQQTAIAITGPPPGHPDYNPNFVPYTGYQTNVDSLAVSATTTAPDNSTTFELFRTVLTSGLVTLGTLNTAFQRRRAPHAIFQLQTPAVTGVLSSEAINYLSVSGTYTLPAASISNTQIISVVSTVSGACTIAASGADLMFGFYPTPASGVTSFALTDGNAATLGAINGLWQLLQGTTGVLGGGSPFGGNPPGSLSGGYLTVTNGTTLTFARTVGTQVPISGVFQTIPVSGITLANTGLVASTLYYIYVGMVGAVMTLFASTTGHVIGPNGYPVQSGDTTKTLLGMIFTDGSTPGQFVPLATQSILCLNFYNRILISGSAGPVGTTGSATLVELSTSFRINILTWVDTLVNVVLIGEQQNNASGGGGECNVAFDGGPVSFSFWGANDTANLFMPAGSIANTTLTEGSHYVTTLVQRVTGGAATFALGMDLTLTG